MLSLAAPIWLIGLTVIPLIWWLHRLGDPDAAAPVSAAFLFNTQADETKTSHTLPRANPLWILRATLLSLLVLALARLTWTLDSERHITVWLDDSISMHAHEDERTRTVIAARKLGAALDEADPAKVQIRLLSNHRQQFDASALAGEPRSAAIVSWADSHRPGSPQIPFTLPRETENWLVSDGADHRVNAWMDGVVFSRTIAVGSETENAAITAIMARRSLQQTALHHGSVRVHNLGTADSKRTLTVRADGQVVLDEDIEITPGGVIYRNFRVPADAALVAARLLPGDALALDDTLEIDMDGLRPVMVDFDNRCGSHFSGALKAHPGLELRAGTEQETALAVRCAPSPEPSAIPSISVHSATAYQAVTGPVQWHRPLPGLSGMTLDPSWLLINPDSARPPSNLTLLSSPDMELSLIDAQAGAIDVFLDFESAPIVERLEYPLLVNALVELALARPVLDPVVHATRNLTESHIARQPEPGIIASPAAIMHTRTDMTPYLLVLATLLLLADVLISLPGGTLRGRASRGAA
jgi:hypothetical protein